MFIHLHAHSHYSFLRAVPSPEEIVAAAAEQKMPAVALTDTNGLYAAVPFYQSARAAGVKPIIGAVVDVGTGLALPLQSGSEPPHSKGAACCAPTTLSLLAANLAGYSNLCALVTQRQIEEKPLQLEALNERREGLIALYSPKLEKRKTKSEEQIPRFARNDIKNGHEEEDAFATALKDIFGDALYLEVQNLREQGAASRAPTTSNLRRALELSRELGIPLVATNNVHFLRRDEHLHHRVLNAIRTGGLLTTVAPPDITSAEAYFKSADEMRRAFPDHPEALRATLEIAERCNLELPLGKTIFPEFPVPEGETPFSYLWKLCFEGARRRYRPVTPEVLARLTHELGVIEKLHLAPYFLLVWDIVEEARRRSIPAVARGSAASSMVTYCLGVSRVCPLRWGLYFERFLNEQRGDIPDIDLDICGARRDELLDYVYQRWGQEHVAMIGSFVTMHARLAVREVAKVFGLSPAEVNHFTRRLPHRPVREIQEAIRTLPECRDLPAREEPWKTILDVALRLDGFPRHLGIHPCGTVIAAQPLTRLVPLEWATKGIVVTQYDMNAVEALGLIKMDLLGQRGLTTMSLALANIESTIVGAQHAAPARAGDGHGMPCPYNDHIDFDAIPEDDPATCAMLAAGRTMGVFQIESPGMRGLLRALGKRKLKKQEGGQGFSPAETALVTSSLPAPAASAAVAGKNNKKGRPNGTAEAVPSPGTKNAVPSNDFSLEDICLALALIRPGAAEYGSKELFLKRLRGQEPVRFPHARLAPILGETLGVCVYQEQVMQLAQAAGGLSLAEADLVRRWSAKFADQRERERLRAKFLKSAARMGLEGAARDDTWHMVEKFAGFGFCKAHAATYADLSYRIAYLKAHYPAEFLAAMCSSGAGFYHVSAYVEEAKRWGIEVRPPSVNASRLEYTTEHVGARHGVPVGAACCAPTTENHRQDASPMYAIRIGLMQVKGLRVETIRAIVRSREERGPYRSLEDFLTRVPVERDEIESLIKCGAFDCSGDFTSPSRPALLWKLNLIGTHREAAPPSALLFAEAAAPRRATDIPQLADYTREQRLACEQAILEVCVSGHPLDLVPRDGEAWSTDVLRATEFCGTGPWPRQETASPPPGASAPEGIRVGQRVTLLGWVITFRHVGTKNYRNMMFVTLEDQRGVFEVVLFPEAYERYGGLVFETRALRVTGRVEPDGQINCEKMERVAGTGSFVAPALRPTQPPSAEW